MWKVLCSFEMKIITVTIKTTKKGGNAGFQKGRIKEVYLGAWEWKTKELKVCSRLLLAPHPSPTLKSEK